MDTMIQLNRDHGLTIVLVTHDPTVGAQAHRIVRMQDGEITGEEHAVPITRDAFAATPMTA
jgi:putative ABC transport system ATP-binding protein